NASLNGSPLRSGYGALDYLFSRDNVWPNLRQYLGWLVDSQTPMVLAGIAAMAVPLTRWWPATRDRSVFIAINGFVLALWVMYGFFLRSDVWWYLRYLLSSWPFIMLGVGAVIVTLTRSASPVSKIAVASLVIALGVHEVGVAADRSVFDRWKNDRHY